LSDISKSLISNYALENNIEPIRAKEPLNVIDEMERERLGFDSVEVTEKMFEYWNFDKAMIDLLANFKRASTPKEQALFIARDIVTIDARIDEEALLKYPQIKERIEKLQ
jgi:HD-like signal output (HDOD) protein